MRKERKENYFIRKPYYEGGLKSMREFIAKNKKYPQEALNEGIEGVVYLKYTIDYKGKVIGTKVLRSLGYGCDEEAQRVVKLLEFEAPKNRGVKIKFFKNIQIHFKLPKEKVVNAPQNVPQQNYAYTMIPTQKENLTPKKKSYTIKIKY